MSRAVFAVLVLASVAQAQPSCFMQTGPSLTLTGTYPTGYGNTGLAALMKVDARGVLFTDSEAILAPAGPYRLGQATGLCAVGGWVHGNYPPDAGWAYYHDTSRNHGGFQLRAPNSTVSGLWIDNVEDGLRVESAAENFLFTGIELTEIHDDAFDAHEGKGGTFDDILADGVYVGLSAAVDPGVDASDKTLTVRNSLVRLKPWTNPDTGETNPGHGGFWKWRGDVSPNCSANGCSQQLVIEGNIFYAQQPTNSQNNDGIGIPAMVQAKLVACCNNTVVWRGAGPFPDPLGSDPTTGQPCLTVTTDQGVWDTAVAAWRARHPRGIETMRKGAGVHGGGRL